MHGILTDDVDLAQRGLGDVTHFVAERVSGRRNQPLSGAINTVACWGDTRAVREEPECAAVAADGTRATPDVDGHHWGTVCPTDPDYRTGLLERIERVDVIGDVRLTTIGFPGDAFCHCERCERQFGGSEHDDRDAWRSDVVTAFVEAAADRVAGDLVVTLYPDPYPGNLRERSGVDPRRLADHVDGVLVPLCGKGYETVYWVEALARGFARELDGLGVELTIQLSTEGVGVDGLADLTRIVEPHADVVVYGTHPGTAEVVRETLRRVREDVEATAAR